ncbi:MAG: DUF1697 domain-containing protein [Flavobacteriaceae bacterium]|nr:DUF1697 domain-containing protein [Flavobacteriaceae bacterium]
MKYIALLKGVNVGGHKKMRMAELRAVLVKAGCSNVSTYIQSGNVCFQTSLHNAEEIEMTIKKAIRTHFGFEVSVILKTLEALQQIFDNCPFSQDEKMGSYFMLLHQKPTAEDVAVALEKVYENESYQIIEDCIYYYSSKGLGKSKFNAVFFENKLQTFITSRNYKTILKLLSLYA